jgi:hypothetical protein
MKALVPRLLLGTALVAAGVLGGASAAQAAPTGCALEIGTPNDGARVKCTSGTGEVRVGIECLVMKPGDPFTVVHHGAWVGVGAYSSAACGGGPVLSDAWYETR